jgi:hypothetical protein
LHSRGCLRCSCTVGLLDWGLQSNAVQSTCIQSNVWTNSAVLLMRTDVLRVEATCSSGHCSHQLQRQYGAVSHWKLHASISNRPASSLRRYLPARPFSETSVPGLAAGACRRVARVVSLLGAPVAHCLRNRRVSACHVACLSGFGSLQSIMSSCRVQSHHDRRWPWAQVFLK